MRSRRVTASSAAATNPAFEYSHASRLTIGLSDALPDSRALSFFGRVGVVAEVLQFHRAKQSVCVIRSGFRCRKLRRVDREQGDLKGCGAVADLSAQLPQVVAVTQRFERGRIGHIQFGRLMFPYLCAGQIIQGQLIRICGLNRCPAKDRASGGYFATQIQWGPEGCRARSTHRHVRGFPHPAPPGATCRHVTGSPSVSPHSQ